ncbi:hypothetical protein EW026_g7220 [Hermanssonia centrifuga]|uniref:Uncharacterized protein n=1 Tax=Hermanssonia centrifuga TaxID=98765 RepID=A0A4S4K8M1_9APHY|nr:hypothetical protein EW026_g7220 [Hermanssonia centrifuga]
MVPNSQAHECFRSWRTPNPERRFVIHGLSLRWYKDSALAIGTGFSQLFRGIGQVGGVALSSAIFQSSLNTQLHERIVGDGAEKLITEIRHSATLVARLPPQIQRIARDSYAISLQTVFIAAACSTLIAYLIRLPIPDKSLGEDPCAQQKADESAPTSPSTLETSLIEESDEDWSAAAPLDFKPQDNHMSYESSICDTDDHDRRG